MHLFYLLVLVSFPSEHAAGQSAPSGGYDPSSRLSWTFSNLLRTGTNSGSATGSAATAQGTGLSPSYPRSISAIGTIKAPYPISPVSSSSPAQAITNIEVGKSDSANASSNGRIGDRPLTTNQAKSGYVVASPVSPTAASLASSGTTLSSGQSHLLGFPIHDSRTTDSGSSMITPPPVLLLSTSIDPRGSSASLDGMIIGGMLHRLHKSANSISNDFTIPATKSAFLDKIRDTEDSMHNLFKSMGGNLPPDTNGCSSGARRFKRGIGSLLGDVFNTVRCAINHLDTLRGHVDVPKPDFPTIKGDLPDTESLAGNIDPNDERDSSKSDTQSHESTESGSSTSSGSSASTTSTSASMSSSGPSSSSSSSSSDPCFGSHITSGAIDLGKRETTADACSYVCPSSMPDAPTTGPLAITPEPTEPADAEKLRRDIAGRVDLDKRANSSPISFINRCSLTTPANDPIRTPDYLGGGAFWSSESRGQLAPTLQTLSRYYKATSDDSYGRCAPTITAVAVRAVRPTQESTNPNEIITTDHAYENNWLKGFLESIIAPANPQGQYLHCDGANAIFFETWTGKPPCTNRLKPLYDALASAVHPDFVIMTSYLNNAGKGRIMSPSFDETGGDLFDPDNKVGMGIHSWAAAEVAINIKFARLKLMLIGCATIGADNTIALMQRTNNRIYQAMQDLDASLQTAVHGAYRTANFAGQYRAYMDKRARRFNQAPSIATRLMLSIQDDLQAATSLQDVVPAERGNLAFLLASYKAQYLTAAKGAWQYDIQWTWDTTNTRRDYLLLPRDDAQCPLEVPSSVSLPSGFASDANIEPSPTATQAMTGTNADGIFPPGSGFAAISGTGTSPAGTGSMTSPAISRSLRGSGNGFPVVIPSHSTGSATKNALTATVNDIFGNLLNNSRLFPTPPPPSGASISNIAASQSSSATHGLPQSRTSTFSSPSLRVSPTSILSTALDTAVSGSAVSQSVDNEFSGILFSLSTSSSAFSSVLPSSSSFALGPTGNSAPFSISSTESVSETTSPGSSAMPLSTEMSGLPSSKTSTSSNLVSSTGSNKGILGLPLDTLLLAPSSSQSSFQSSTVGLSTDTSQSMASTFNGLTSAGSPSHSYSLSSTKDSPRVASQSKGSTASGSTGSGFQSARPSTSSPPPPFPSTSTAVPSSPSGFNAFGLGSLPLALPRSSPGASGGTALSTSLVQSLASNTSAPHLSSMSSSVTLTKQDQTPSPTQSKPLPSTCSGGKFNNLDECTDNCYHGLCQENAGQPQITCSCVDPGPSTTQPPPPSSTAPPPPPPPPPPSTPDPPPPSPPQPPPKPTNICSTEWKGLYNYFEVRGSDFDPKKFGTNGSGLKSEIKGCGALTNWLWKLTPHDPRFDWFARGQLPIDTTGCVGRAVISAGGEKHDGC